MNDSNKMVQKSMHQVSEGHSAITMKQKKDFSYLKRVGITLIKQSRIQNSI